MAAGGSPGAKCEGDWCGINEMVTVRVESPLGRGRQRVQWALISLDVVLVGPEVVLLAKLRYLGSSSIVVSNRAHSGERSRK